MAELTEGAYLILSCISDGPNANLAIDVKGGSDKSAANVQLWRVKKNDSQIWYATKPDGGNTWRFTCSLSGKVLDIYGSNPASGNNVVQNDEWSGSSIDQRWVLTERGSYTWFDQSYTKYAIRCASNTSLALDVYRKGTAEGTNIEVYTYSSSAVNQQFIFVPVPIFSYEGTFRIASYDDPKMCVDISGGATTSGANAIIYSNSDKNNQIFYADRDEDDGTFRFIPAHVLDTVESPEDPNDLASELKKLRCLDIWAKDWNSSAANSRSVCLYKVQDSRRTQKWLPVRAVATTTAKIDGVSYQLYEIRCVDHADYVMDVLGGKAKASANLGVYERHSAYHPYSVTNQLFFFPKALMTGSRLSTPGAINEQSFVRKNAGTIDLTGKKITFSSKYSDFQARYKIRRYTPRRESYTEDPWKNLMDDSVARDGWGDAWYKTFSATPDEKGVVTIPSSAKIFKTYTINSTDSRSIDIIVEIRVLSSNYGPMHVRAKSNTRTSTINLSQLPEIASASLSVGSDASKYNKFYLTGRLTRAANPGYTIENIKARILDSASEPISDWVSSTGQAVDFIATNSLYRLPTQGESLYLEYSILTDDDYVLHEKKALTFYYGSNPRPSISNRTVTNLTDGSCCVEVEVDSLSTMYCMTQVNNTDGMALADGVIRPSSNGRTKWRCMPPLNQNVKIFIVGSDSGTSWGYSEVTVRVDSHLFIWNWEDQTAALLINSDDPPQQTRSYTTDIQFNVPAARMYPVAFSGINVTADLSVEGVTVDENASYQAFAPMPPYTALEDIKKLIRLSGRGIHPVYRTPYGDWNTVGIESIDISKKHVGLTEISVKQRAVED